jgi:hypothetical protein
MIFSKFFPKLNGQLYNEFAAAVMRFGHSEILNAFSRADSNGNVIPSSELTFSSINFNTNEAYK